MMTRRQLLEWSLFAVTALLFCLLLSFRPVPGLVNVNDTGRYVQAFHQYCTVSEIAQAASQEASYIMFYATTLPACLAKSDGIFLFEVAAFLPLIFLLFVKWRNGTYLWACSLMFSVTGLEMMTNALRQSLGTLLCFGAIALWARHRVIAFLMVAAAVAAHISVLFYIPLFLWFAGARVSKRLLIIGGVALVLLCIVFYAPINAFINDTMDSYTFYSAIYADPLSSSFILFIILPMFWVYVVRHYHARKHISIEEKTALLYSTALLLICFFAFPAILYRFALF